jgi:hypothetical protein
MVDAVYRYLDYGRVVTGSGMIQSCVQERGVNPVSRFPVRLRRGLMI